MHKHMRGLSAVAAVLGVALAGCGDTGGQAGEDVQLTYWATNMSSSIAADEAVLQPQLQEFTRQTGVDVELEVVPWDSLWNRILTSVSSGQGPDVLNIGNTWSASLQATEAFVEFDDDVMAVIGGTGRFVATSLAATGADGEPPVGVPLYGQAYGLYYNTQLFEDADIDQPPSTWEEFVDVGQQLTQDTDGDGEIDKWGVALLGGAAPVNAHFAFILGRQHGGALFDDSGAPQFDSDEQVAAVRRYLDLMATDRIASPANAEFTRTEAVTELAQGDAAMYFGQATARGILAALDFADYGIAPMPLPEELPDGGQPVRSMVAGINVTVMDHTDHRDEALELVEFLTGDEAQVALNEAYGTLPVVENAYEHEAFADEGLQTLRTVLRDDAEPFPQVPEIGQAETLVGGAMKELFAQAATGTVTDHDIRSALEDASSQLAASR